MENFSQQISFTVKQKKRKKSKSQKSEMLKSLKNGNLFWKYMDLSSGESIHEFQFHATFLTELLSI